MRAVCVSHERLISANSHWGTLREHFSTTYVGMPQIKRNGEIEPMLITSGDDAINVARFAPDGGNEYSVSDVIRYLLKGVPARRDGPQTEERMRPLPLIGHANALFRFSRPTPSTNSAIPPALQHKRLMEFASGLKPLWLPPAVR